ncbi:MAG: hypothetical protein QOE70_268 [Chthoniobacter sp.]|nr:hypothetical protein [Chthoniobacter sp.]
MNRFFESIALRPEVGRALRSSFAFLIPLLVCHALGRPADGVFIAIAAQTIALPDLRGAYAMRLMILATMTLVVAGSALLGVWAGGNIISATLAMGVLALLGSGWRHLSADYGPHLSVSSALLFLLGLAQAGSWSAGLHLAGLILLGGVGASLLHIAFWPFRPQHPLRYAVAESWVAVSDLVASMRLHRAGAAPAQNEAIIEGERELRATLDRTFVILGAAESRQSSALLKHLEEMRREVVHLAMRVVAFHTSLEPLLGRPEFVRHVPTVDSLLKALSDAARSVAITLVTHRAGNFAATEVRLQRCLHLLRVLEEQLAAASAAPGVAQLRATLEQIAQALPRIAKALEETIDHGEARFSFPARLPELSSRSLRSLAAWINPSSQLDPVLVRYSLRIAVLTMLAVALYKGFAIPHGYWIAFTIVVVLQPDYGSTRQRAGERIGGTLAGSLLGSALLWIKLPLFLLDGYAALMAFAFAYFLKRRYGVAVFFVTLMLVLITETTTKVHLDFTITRLLSNIVGGAVALISALVFWPIWEGEKFTSLLAAAIRANRVYLDSVSAFLTDTNPNAETLLMTKRRAENANRFAAASLQRMLAEPGDRTGSDQRAAALTTYNQRITRAFTAIAVHLQDGIMAPDSGLGAAAREISDALETLARAIEEGAEGGGAAALATQLSRLESLFANAPFTTEPASFAASQTELIWTHLAKSVAEIRAMALALQPSNGSGKA